jgi:hypothetical protein
MSSDVYVIFEDDQTNWWSRYLKKNIRHCYVVKPSGQGFLVFAKNCSGFDLFTTTDEKSIIGSKCILKIKPKDNQHSLFMLNTCVGHTKQILGIRNPFILTPYQLLKYLEKHHGIYETT